MIDISDIRAERARRGWTQEDLAGRVGVSWGTIKRIEKSQENLNVASFSTIRKIAEVLEIEL